MFGKTGEYSKSKRKKHTDEKKEFKLNNFEVSITRFDAAEVAAEVEHAREIEKQMAKEAREKMRAERTEEFKETVSQKSEELKNWFSHLGKKE